MLNQLLKGDTAVWRTARTAVQAVIGFFVGLLAVVWAVPGVPQAVNNYVSGHWIGLLAAFGIPTVVASLIWNLLRQDVKNV